MTAWGANSAATSPLYRCRVQAVDLSPGSLRYLRALMRQCRHRPGHPLKRHGGRRERAEQIHPLPALPVELSGLQHCARNAERTLLSMYGIFR